MDRITRAFILMIFTTLFTSFAQVMYKFAVDDLSFSIISIVTNPYLIAGLILYSIAASIMLVAFRAADLSALYPIIATSYIWVALLSNYFFNDSLNLYKWIGILIIVIGVTFVGYGSKKSGMAVELI